MSDTNATATESTTDGSRRRQRLRRLGETLASQAKTVWRSKMAVFGICLILAFTLMAVTAPFIAPYEPNERQYADDGSWKTMESPSAEHPLGTTDDGYDVLSQLIWGSQIAMFVGYLGAFMVAVIGTGAGVVAGYYGGLVDEGVMRFVDILYGLPFIPFVIVIATIFGASVWNVIFGIALLYWLTTARVVRSEVLSIKERPYIEAAKAAGASNLRIMRVHIVPNVLPLSALYAAIAVGYSITAQASIAFLGFSDPTVPSWGVMLQRVFNQQGLDAWWWFLPPGISITLVVLGAYLAGRGYDEIVNPQLQQ
ncbi:ABC transporter permease [Salinadaptatus halalkaliphilus]|uniref:ABC transporter permease n=1 Tax=Salinadaptatus halalkaliphilus TaxID=2419781 RepID=A0A4S3TLK8_9EURY|nr:ABC transporter permease [Salinadaptatus halalkaliphilus]THE65064.1 ABC transporter permease [Salinadaptatus halalkaliphilus]